MRALTTAGRWWVVVLGLSTLFIVLALAFFNPNARRSDIEAWVSEQTGRRFTFAGELGWRIWPRPAVTLPRARLAAAGEVLAGDAPAFAEWQQASLSIRPWPLLRGRLEFGAVQLNGLRLRLRRDASGRNNWQDLLQRFTQEQQPGRFEFASLAALQMQDAEIVFDDAAASRVTTLRIESLRTTAVAFDRPIDILLRAQAASHAAVHTEGQHLDLPFSLSLRAQADATRRHWRLDELRWTGQLAARGGRADARAIQALPLALRWQYAELQNAQQLMVNMLQASIGGAQLSSDELLVRWRDAPEIAATLQFAVPNLRQWLESVGMDLPATRDTTVLQALSAQLHAQGDLQDLRLQPLTLHLDQTQVDGRAHVRIREGRTHYEADLHADRLNLDRYLPVAAAKTSSTPVEPLPIEWLRSLQVRGRLHIDVAQWQAVRAQQLTVTLAGHETDRS